MKYLFEAHFQDGSIIKQTPEDVSTADPSRSAYFDVCQKGLEQLAFFGLYDDKHTYVVDLRDGHFEIDGVPFAPVPSATVPEGSRTLVYYRQHRHHFNPQGKELGHEVQFHFGWESGNQRFVIALP